MIIRRLVSWKVAATILALVALAAVAACADRSNDAQPGPSPITTGSDPTPSITPSPTAPPISPVPTAPARVNPDRQNPTGRLIEISLTKQRLTAWNDGVVVLRTLVSTGMPGYETPRGHFTVRYKSANAWSRTWGVWMPWALNVYRGYFIHQLPHYPGSKVNIGASTLGTAASHGCVRVGIPDAERLYRWARVGTPVWIH